MAMIDVNEYYQDGIGVELKPDSFYGYCDMSTRAAIFSLRIDLSVIVNSITITYTCDNDLTIKGYDTGPITPFLSPIVTKALSGDGIEHTVTLENIQSFAVGDNLFRGNSATIMRSATVSELPAVTITFDTKREDDSELTGVKVYIDEELMGET